MIENRLKKGLGRGLSSLIGDNSKKIQTLGRERPNLQAQRLKIINQFIMRFKIFHFSIN